MTTKFKKIFYNNKLKKLKQQLHDLNFELDCVMLTKLQQMEVDRRKQLINKSMGNCRRKLNSLKECSNG